MNRLNYDMAVAANCGWHWRDKFARKFGTAYDIELTRELCESNPELFGDDEAMKLLSCGQVASCIALRTEAAEDWYKRYTYSSSIASQEYDKDKARAFYTALTS